MRPTSRCAKISGQKSREKHNLHSLKVLSPKILIAYKEENNSFAEKKPCRHQPNQEIKVDITSNEPPETMYSEGHGTIFMVFLPQMHNLPPNTRQILTGVCSIR